MPSEHDPWITLALAIVYQAMLDVHYGHPARAVEAQSWLQCMGLSWCQVLDVPESVLEDWADNNFMLPDHLRRNWRY